MKTRVRTTKLSHGDVRALRNSDNKGMTRIVAYSEERGVPFIQALLGVPEREALRHALGRER